MTQDLDLLIYPSPQNARKVMAALESFGFGGAGIERDLFERPGVAVHLGAEPNRIDLLTQLHDVSNADIFKHLDTVTIESMQLPIIRFEELIRVKQASSRLRDQADAEELLKHRKR